MNLMLYTIQAVFTEFKDFVVISGYDPSLLGNLI